MAFLGIDCMPPFLDEEKFLLCSTDWALPKLPGIPFGVTIPVFGAAFLLVFFVVALLIVLFNIIES